MQAHVHDWHWLDDGQWIGFDELAGACGLAEPELAELVEYGAVRPLASHEEDGRFSAAVVGPLRQACKLRRDYDLDLFTAGLIAGYLQRIAALEEQVRVLHAGSPPVRG